MQDTKFKAGDVVRLNSDTEKNTPMTISAYYWETVKQGLFTFDLLTEEEKHKVKCVWRDKEDVSHTEWFSDKALTIIS
ncbi:MAG: hypothetical protein IKX60_06360 [Bacteroidales bacterium]|nr:hypothetical protein [Bacteroidales bacterium]